MTLLSVLAGLYLYVHSTRPALREQSEIEQMESDLGTKVHELRHELFRLRNKGEGVYRDREALIRELDRKHISMDEADRLASDLLRPSKPR